MFEKSTGSWGLDAAVYDYLNCITSPCPCCFERLGGFCELEAVCYERLDVNFAGSNKFDRSRVAGNKVKSSLDGSGGSSSIRGSLSECFEECESITCAPLLTP